MKRYFALLFAAVIAHAASAQTPPKAPNPVKIFGKVDKSELELKNCEFEKDANAMVLFEKGDLYYDNNFNIIMEYHERIKVFNDNGKDVANIKINYYGGNRLESISDIQAQTYNLNGDKIDVTKIDRKQIYNQTIDKARNQYTFSLPNVKAGSVIEFKYRRTINSVTYIPAWNFQQRIPVAYSELITAIPDFLVFRAPMHITQQFAKNVNTTESKSVGSGQEAFMYTDVKDDRALANVHSLPDEPYMTSESDNLQNIHFVLVSYRPVGGLQKDFQNSWEKIGKLLMDDEDFGGQLKRKLNNEEPIIAKAKSLKTNDEKIAYVFGEVKNAMKWDGVDRWYTNDGTRAAWDKKSGNSTEINLILYHLLTASGVKAYPMVVSTRDNGKVNPVYPFIYQFNRGVVYIPIDSTNHYVLDAANKYNNYRETPFYLLNSSGLYLDKEHDKYELEFLETPSPVRRAIFVNANISADGRMDGSAIIRNQSYDRNDVVKAYKTAGEKKYIEQLSDHDNNLKISSLKMDDIDIDSLPLTQNVQFKLDLTGSDGNYIMFKPTMFTSLQNNPFIKEDRFTDIDFGYRNAIFLNGNYKMPTGYKADALPKNISMVMPDKSIAFTRIIEEHEGTISIAYRIEFKKTIYFKEDYPEMHEFYKKLQEMMNEQIVLKKS
ncbi:DUF3857 domain-containing protein [Mucilaginibacter sp. RS28]|uniref:DUF3857 domain-containing protein n=1 Tax=Mucilaginibacter straminoryzae TaxID=2932774 RepID=A0A9X1X4P4_9SPHI|nr:DUF3857 domain-containing protein [Mucilaginibacter straminoryzae]MCJ8210878.1 DUF3857 domain-containing protein [Mucilaginibacter straminoryzae]